MSHHFANIFSFAGNQCETNTELPVVKVNCDTIHHENTTMTCNNLATTGNKEEYDDYEIRITSVPGPKGDPGGVGGPVEESLIPENMNVDIGTNDSPFRTIYSDCIDTNEVFINGHSIYVADNILQLPADTRIGGLIPGTINIKGSFNSENEIPLTNVSLGDAYLIGNAQNDPVNLYICTKLQPLEFKNVGNISGPVGPPGPIGLTGPQGKAGPGLFYFETLDSNLKLNGSNVAMKIDGIGLSSKAYSKQMYQTCCLTFSSPTQPVSSEIGLVHHSSLAVFHRINFVTNNQYFINNYLDSYDYTPDDLFTIVVSTTFIKFFQNEILIKEFPNESNVSLKAYISLYEVGSTLNDIQFGYAVPGQTGPTGPTGPAGPSVNLTPLNNSINSLNQSVSNIQTKIDENSTTIASLTSLTSGITGDVETLTVQSKLNVKKTSEQYVSLNPLSSIIDYSTTGNFLYNNASTPGPYDYEIVNMNDLQSSNHTFTILHKITENNKLNCYINNIKINGDVYVVQWLNGQRPTDVLSNVMVGGIVKQTFTLLPKAFSNNTIITQLFYYHTL